MLDGRRYEVPSDLKTSAYITSSEYEKKYKESIENPDKFWNEQARNIEWIKPFTKVKNTSFEQGKIDIKWFEDGQLNISQNCLDRHLATKGDDIAIIWEGDSPSLSRQMTYKELHEQVCRFANVLKSQGIKKGDVVVIYMPMVPEAAVAMLACTRIGAIHSVIFGGFSPEAIAGRIIDSNAKLVITSDEGIRGGKIIPLKKNVDAALAKPEITTVEKVIVFERTGHHDAWHSERDIWWHEAVNAADPYCDYEVMDAESPLFILYTSGSTGKPKGVLHSTAGYLVYTTLTFKTVFNYQPKDIFWCTADVGWITGHSYLVYGPLSNGATIVMYEGIPSYPTPNRLSQIVDKYQVNILYTAPTAIRALMAQGDVVVENTHRNSLKLLGTVGEPINPQAWIWYHETIGNSRCPIVDTWWQTETGGFLITPLPGAHALKPGAAMKPFFGVQPALVDNEGNFIEGEGEGNLVIMDSWPSQARTLYGDHARFEEAYFATFKNTYFSGDAAKRDADGDIWITGRVDDVLNISGHRLGTAEVESALVAHPKIAEAAVIGVPHDIKGQAIYAYITLNAGEEADDALYLEVKNWVRNEIGAIATPDYIHATKGLPKTRSGKIMRRILRKIACDEADQLGDISTLADPSVVEKLISEYKCLLAKK
ncbi:acetate--CoA ligase [Thorsellia kenyensis]|uniref:Acetyl-coenzyme A synthetase n=1 Tax=Thorsellia kenyensis TaxID=1549888 RepID=A0ABV6CHJ1_9GAMM